MARQSRKSLADQLTDVVLPIIDITGAVVTEAVNMLTDTATESDATESVNMLTDTESLPSQPTPIAQALLDHGAALATSAEQSSNANAAAKAGSESLAGKCRDVLVMQDTEVQHIVTKAMADLKTIALATMGCPIADATPEQLTNAAAHCLKSFKVLSATLKRQNNTHGKHGLLYMSLDRTSCDATVKVITAPTEAELRQALKDDTKALNAALEAQSAKVKAAKSMADTDDTEQGEDGHVVIGQGVSCITAMAAVLELVAGWRPSELAVASATFHHMALAGRLALLAPDHADHAALAAEVDAARISVTLLTSAYQDEKAAEVAQRNAAQAQQDAELLALRTANAAKRRAELEAEEKALAEANEKMAQRMANSKPEPAPAPTTTESPVESTGELVEPNGALILKSA